MIANVKHQRTDDGFPSLGWQQAVPDERERAPGLRRVLPSAAELYRGEC
jgi:hypothetical protein